MDEKGADQALALRANPNCYDETVESALLVALRCPLFAVRYRLVQTLLGVRYSPINRIKVRLLLCIMLCILIKKRLRIIHQIKI